METADEWEINTIGQFLVELQQELLITSRDDFYVKKELVCDRFIQFAKQRQNLISEFQLRGNEKTDIGYLLHRTNFLINTRRGSEFFRIRGTALLQHRQKILNAYDEIRKGKNDDDLIATVNADRHENKENVAANNRCGPTSHGGLSPAKKHMLEVADNAPCHALAYQGAGEQKLDSTFQLTSWSCCICQKHFSASDYEEHVEEHGVDSDFERLTDLSKSTMAVFKLSYQLCRESNFVRFAIEVQEALNSTKEITLDRIMLVQTRSFYYVHNAHMPHTLSQADMGRYTFYMDSHLLSIHVEQPIVLVFRQRHLPGRLFVEQHHFLRSDKFPSTLLAIRPSHLLQKIAFKPKCELSQYFTPVELLNALRTTGQNDDSVQRLMEMSNEFKEYYNAGMKYNPNNYLKALTLLLQVEDYDASVNYYELTQQHVELKQKEKYIVVDVQSTSRLNAGNILSQWDEVVFIPESKLKTPHTDENLLKLMSLTVNDTSKSKGLFGQVERVSGTGRVTVLCHSKINSALRYTVLFRPQRMTLRYQYRALDLLSSMPAKQFRSLIFPQCTSKGTLKLPEYKLKLKNETIGKNPEQLQTVYNILSGCDVPYIIFGPPGTGKTTTIVEAIWQLYTLRPEARILITAASNSACDEVAKRLCLLLGPCNDPRAIVRVYSRSMGERVENIDEALLECSNLYDSHFYPHVDVLHEYRICVCTFSVVGKLCSGKFGHVATAFNGDSSHFTHLFVDECAASTEPETLTGIVGVLSSKTRVILAGDDKQLGPILQSTRAQDWGLGVSMMERLLQRDCYRVDKHGNYDRDIQTRLRRNFRSHPAIVSLYNGLYYNNELLSCASDDVNKLTRNWCLSPNPLYPIIFHSVCGPTTRDNNSTSLYNIKELEMVMSYVKDLMYLGINEGGVNGRRIPITQRDIGIISPYKKQYQRIQEELNIRHWYDIETGSVETFQGKEKPIIIVSFVRSFSSTIGFLDNPRRLNVTISRPKSLLILIGNPKTLSMQSDFKQIIDRCRLNRTLVNTRIPERINEDTVTANADNNITSLKRPPATQKKKGQKKPQQKNRTGVQGGVVSTATKKKLSSRMQLNSKNMNMCSERTALDDMFDSLPRIPNANTKPTTSAIKNSTSNIAALRERLSRLSLRNNNSVISTPITTGTKPITFLGDIVNETRPANVHPSRPIFSPTSISKSQRPIFSPTSTSKFRERARAQLQKAKSSCIIA